MPKYMMKAYAWKGHTGYDKPVEMIVADDDDQMDWFNQDKGEAETATINGVTHEISHTGTIKTEFKTPDGDTHVEEFTFTYSAHGYHFIPPPGSAFEEGSKLIRFPDNKWSDTDGVKYKDVICFTPGCRILTARGLVPAGALKLGDVVQTADNGLQKIRWIGRSDLGPLRRVSQHLHPVRIRADAFGPGLPPRDVLVSPQHRFRLTGTEMLFHTPEALAPAKALVDGERVQLLRGWGPVSYIHILLDRHEILFCDGLATESFLPTPENLACVSAAARHALMRAAPDLARFEALARPALKPWEAALLPRVGFAL